MFITIDGPDGSGKTTLARLLAVMLPTRRITTYTAEPTDTPLGQEIRRILKTGTKAEQRTLTKLFVQDRRTHLKNLVMPELAQGRIVVCDGYKYSTVCYQQLQGVNLKRLITINKDFISPDYAFILNTDDIDVLIRRITARGEQYDFFERRAYLTQMSEIYNRMGDYFPDENIVMLDAAQPLDVLMKTILEQLEGI